VALKRRDAISRHDAFGPRVRVIVAEAELVAREWLVATLATEPHVEVVAVCATRTEFDAAIAGCDPDVVVTDLRTPPCDTDEGLALVARLRHRVPPIGVVVLSHDAEPEQVCAFLEGGSARRGYLLRRSIRTRLELISAIERVASGDSIVDPTVLDILIDAQARASHSRLERLTPRELEVLAGVACGRSNSSIAERLVLSVRAVEKHVGSIFLKLDLRDTEDASRRVVAALIYHAEAQAAECAGSATAWALTTLRCCCCVAATERPSAI
jgi:DNA-binding NarL/FixJ family response regulator